MRNMWERENWKKKKRCFRDKIRKSPKQKP